MKNNKKNYNNNRLINRILSFFLYLEDGKDSKKEKPKIIIKFHNYTRRYKSITFNNMIKNNFLLVSLSGWRISLMLTY